MINFLDGVVQKSLDTIVNKFKSLLLGAFAPLCIRYTQMSLTSACTMFLYYTKLLRVSTICLGRLKGVTSLVDVYSVFGNFSQMIGRLCGKNQIYLQNFY